MPTIKEQQEIVHILDNLLENEQKAKELCDVIDKIDHMKKSILARTFRGELSTNNPAEESALELLKEVLLEKV
jgi:type I restriction enzyme S subunit